MIVNLCRAGIALASMLTCCLASAQIAVFALNELAHESKSVCIVKVEDISDPNWRDENGSRILLANAIVVRRLKGALGEQVVMAFKPNVGDEAQFAEGRSYVVFSFGVATTLMMAHQLRALPIEGGQVYTAELQGEPKSQPLESLVRRLTKTP